IFALLHVNPDCAMTMAAPLRQLRRKARRPNAIGFSATANSACCFNESRLCAMVKFTEEGRQDEQAHQNRLDRRHGTGRRIRFSCTDFDWSPNWPAATAAGGAYCAGPSRTGVHLDRGLLVSRGKPL